jgi:acyl carrier protein
MVLLIALTSIWQVKKLEKSLDFELYGDNGNLDSMDLVSFIVDVEQAIDKTFNSPVVLADEKSLSQFNSPFKSVETLLNYIITKLSDV